MKISVIMATYNGAEYIEQQINSIVNQTEKVDEIIVCDDNSSDDTYEILGRLKNNIDINLILYKHKENKGVKKTFIELIEKAKGDIVFFSDQDDFWYRNKVKDMVEIIKEGKDIVMSNADITDAKLNKSNLTLWQCLGIENEKYRNDDCYIEKEMLKRNIFTGMNMCFKRNVYQKSKMEIDMYHDEYIGWLGVFNKSVGLLNKSLAAYRQHKTNVVGVSKRTSFESFEQMYKKIMESTRKRYNNLLWVSDCLKDNYVLEAENFYKQRLTIYQKKSILYFMKMLLIHNISYRYSNYTARKEKALIKDLFCVLYGRLFYK